MGTYLLLRDNKESGPYSLEQLLACGLKAYDLVWINGRSAAWRYPSEIEELQAYAPVVEEQPFDRFYKKPEETSQSARPSFVPQPKAAKDAEPVINSSQSEYEAYQPRIVAAEEKEAKPTTPARKSVFVTLPATPIDMYTQPEEPVVAMPGEPAPTIKVVENKEAAQIKFSQPLDEIKEQYVKTLLDRKQKISRHTVWMQQLRIAGIMIVLIGGGILLGWAMSNRNQRPDLPGVPRQLALAANPEPESAQPAAPDNNNPVVPETVTEGTVMSAGAEEQVEEDLKVKEAREAAAKEARLKKIIANSPPPTAEEKMLGEATAGNGISVTQTDRGRNAKAVMGKADPQRSPVTEEPDSYQRSNTDLATGERSRRSRDEQENADNKLNRKSSLISSSNGKGGVIASGRDIPKEVTVLSNNYKRVPFGGIRDLRLTVYNRSDEPLEKVIVELKYLKPSEETLKTQWIEFPAIDAKSSATIKVPDTNRGIDVVYQISSVVKAR